MDQQVEAPPRERRSAMRRIALLTALCAAAANVVIAEPAMAAPQVPVNVDGPYLGLTSFLPSVGDMPSATVDNGGVTLGAIRLLGGNFTPGTSWAPTGQVVSAASYPNGPALYGSTFGGDGVTTFGVPDLVGRSAIGAGAGPGLSPVAAGQKVGSSQVTITREQMPVTHGGQGSPFVRRPPAVGLNYLIRTAGRNASTSTILFDSVGVVVPYAGTVIPAGWMVADGSLLAPAQYPALFAVIGTTYGGDGVTTFALPDLRGRAPVQAGCGPGLVCRTLGQQFGSDAVTITAAHLPDALGGSRQNLDNNAPSLALNYVCNMFGIFPSRIVDNADSVELFIGEVVLYAGSFLDRQPTCGGQLLNLQQNQALFSILGTNFGGSGVTTFGLPDLRGRTAVGPRPSAGLDNIYVGQLGGSSSLPAWSSLSFWPDPVAPGTPSGVAAVAGDGEASVSWTAPISNGGSPLTGYVVTPYIGAAAQTPVVVTPTSTDTTVTGLTNGAAYTFTVAATNSAGTGTASVATDPVVPLPPLSVSIGDVSLHEGDGKTRSLSFPVTLSSPSTAAVSVDYTVAGVDATGGTRPLSGIDFKAVPTKTLSFPVTPSGSTAVQKYVKVLVYSDELPESSESLTVTLSNPTGATLGRSTGTGTIVDDDTHAGTVVSVGDASVVEGDTGKTRAAQFAVTLSKPATSQVTVTYRIVPGSATGNYKSGAVPPGTDLRDYRGEIKTLPFKPTAAGVTGVAKFVSVAVFPDWPQEVDETFQIEIVSVDGPATIGDALGDGVILDDD
jgi:microcystin-dependent protein